LTLIIARHLVVPRKNRTLKFFSICAERGGKRVANKVQWDVETKSFLIYTSLRIFLSLPIASYSYYAEHICEGIFLSNAIARGRKWKKLKSVTHVFSWKLEWFFNEVFFSKRNTQSTKFWCKLESLIFNSVFPFFLRVYSRGCEP